MQPVFEKGASATDNSLIAAGRAIVVENNYGYSGPTSTQDGKTTTPGLERVDLDADGTAAARSGAPRRSRRPSCPKLSAANGIVYTYTKDPQPDSQDAVVPDRAGLPHRRDALQAPGRRGARPQQQLRADHARPRRHRAYVGVLGGLIGLRDATPPPGAPGAPGATPGARRAPGSLRLKVRRLEGGRLRARVVGKGVGQVRRVTFRVRGKTVRVDRKRPFKATLARKRLRRHGRTGSSRGSYARMAPARSGSSASAAGTRGERQLRWVGW